MAPKKTVFIFGAGASCHAGLPVLQNFFTHAYSIREQNVHGQNPPNGYTMALDKVDGFRSRLKKDKPQINIFNIEAVYAEALSIQDQDLVAALDRVIFGVLDLGGCTAHYNSKQYQPDSVYALFSAPERIDRKNTSFITFNWDCLLDYSLSWHVHPIDYCFTEATNPNAVKLIKLHGSINFGQCKDCKDISPVIVKPNDHIGFRPGVERRGNVTLDLRIASEVLPKQKCQQCQKTGLTPIIIPPSLEKDFSAVMQAPVRAAKKLIQEAESHYFIGYSFPESDKYFIDFMRDALTENIRLTQINVVNPDVTVEGVYERNLEAKKRHIGINLIQETFEIFAGKYQPQ